MGKDEEGENSKGESKECKPVASRPLQYSANAVKPPTEMSWIGNIGENWKFFKQKFEIYLIASRCSSSDESEYCTALLLNAIGDRALKIYNNFTFEQSENQRDFKVVLKKFDSYFLPEVNETYERHSFFLREQHVDESIDQYVTELRDLSSTCNFGSLTDNLIRDRIVLGIRDRSIKDRLLRIKDLDLNKALEVCRAAERTKSQLADICPQNSDEVLKINKHGSNKDSSSRSQKPWFRNEQKPAGFKSQKNISRPRSLESEKLCNRCGYSHARFKCSAYGKRCNTCKKMNHYASQCNSNKKVNSVEDNDNFFVGGINTLTYINPSVSSVSHSKPNDWLVDIEINYKFISFKLDTGAQVNCVNAQVLKEIGHDLHNLIPTKNRLTTYTGQKIDVLGSCNLCCFYKGKRHILDFHVVNSNCTCILGLEACRKLDLIRKVDTCSVNPCKSSVENNGKPNILDEYPDMTQGIGCLKGEHEIKLKENYVSKIHAPRKIPFKIKPILKNKLDELEHMQIIEKVEKPTEWVNSLVLVHKNDGDLRICMDPKDLNKAVMRPHFQLPTFDDISTKLAGSTIFSTLDTKCAFWHVKLTKSSSDLCTFNTPFGRYKFLRLPYGLCSASEIFSLKLSQILENMEGVALYIDDLIIFGKNRDEHDKRLRLVLSKLRSENIKLNKSKCKIGIHEIKFLGHCINKNGISIDNDRAKAIVEMENPTDKKSLERFLGVVTYVSRFLPNISNVTAPLRSLLKKNVEFAWSYEHTESFNKIKNILSTQPVLQFFDEKLPVVLSVDAAKDGLGAVLLQNNLPVAYSSKALSPTQQAYAQIEKELLAVLNGCQKFHQFIYGSHFTVESDHLPLMSIVKKNIESCPPRLQRMLIKLQKYDFELIYKKGKELYIADTLSRACDKSDNSNVIIETEELEAHVNLVMSNINISDKQLNKLVNVTESDSELTVLKSFVLNGWPNHKNDLPIEVRPYWNVRGELTLSKGLIVKGTALLIPKQMRHEMLTRLHYSHSGVTKTQLKAKDVVYWPNINNHIADIVSKCETCITYAKNYRSEPLMPHEVPSLPWEKVGTDIFQIGNAFFLLVVDYFSKYPELVKLTSTKSEQVIRHLKEIFSRHGIPKVVFSDNATQFQSRFFDHFTEVWGFEHHTSSPNYPQSNGMIERAIQSVKDLLKKCKFDKTDPFLAMLEFRNTPLSSDLPSPVEILFSRKLRGIIPCQSSNLKPKLSYGVRNKLLLRQSKQKMYFDKKTRNLPELPVNHPILIKHDGKWVKSRIVSKDKRPRSYIVKSSRPNQNLVRNRQHIRPVNPNQYSPADDDVYVSVPSCRTNVCSPKSKPTTPRPSPTKSPTLTVPISNQVSTDLSNNDTFKTKSGRIIKKPEKLNL